MLQKILLTLTMLAIASAASAQTACPPPVLKVMQNNQEIPGTRTAFTTKVTLLVSPAPACAGMVSYQFTEAEITLFRGQRPVLPTIVVPRAQADLSMMKQYVKPGDRIFIYVAYKHLTVVAADGKQHPYPEPVVPAVSPQGGFEAQLANYEARGVTFTWLLP